MDSTVPSPRAQTPAPSSRPNPTAQLVAYGRQGGLLGVSDRLTVRENGAFTLIRSRPRSVDRSGHLTAAELANLRQVLSGAGFATMPKVQRGDAVDVYTYTVSYAGYQITAQEGAVVPALRPVLATLANLVAKYSA
jgi:hypothetical protein